MSGLSIGRSMAFSSGSSAEASASRTVPKGTTPSRISCSISWPRMPLRSKGAISARMPAIGQPGTWSVQNGAS